MLRAVASLALTSSLVLAASDTCADVNLSGADGLDIREGNESDFYLVALLYAWWGYCKSQAARMATIYYSMLDDDARSKISFLIVNAGSASQYRSDLERAARYNSGGTVMGTLPVYQDDSTSTLLNAISNNDPYPKDDIALFDSEGRVVAYWESNQSFLGGQPTTNAIIQKVREVTADGYVSPCAPAVQDPETEQPGGELSLSQFKDLCRTSTDNCRACKGKIKDGECRIKVKSCKKLRTEEMCRAARCKVKTKKNKVKCKNKNGSVFD